MGQILKFTISGSHNHYFKRQDFTSSMLTLPLLYLVYSTHYMIILSNLFFLLQDHIPLKLVNQVLMMSHKILLEVQKQ